MFEQGFHEAFQAAVALGGPAPTANCGAAPAAGSRWLNAHLAWCVARCTSRSARTESNPLLFFCVQTYSTTTNLPCRVLATVSSTPSAPPGAPDQALCKNAAATQPQQQQQLQRSKPGNRAGVYTQRRHASDEIIKGGDAFKAKLVAKHHQRRHCASIASSSSSNYQIKP
jgi:hypothetical protein